MRIVKSDLGVLICMLLAAVYMMYAIVVDLGLGFLGFSWAQIPEPRILYDVASVIGNALWILFIAFLIANLYEVVRRRRSRGL